MPKEFSRSRRVADLIQRELAVVLQREIDREQFGLITISAVDVSPDLAQAKIYFTSLGPRLNEAGLCRELNGMAGHFRHSLARALPLKSMPRLRFEFDSSIERGSRLASLIDSLHKGPGKP
ncbi:MAG: 30S ribosome-binding factor RbfA [Gammaproteobacteria bacterium]|nr:30S ribosome-binding factor RbfA [Gammaproteobacteria bacterium]